MYEQKNVQMLHLLLSHSDKFDVNSYDNLGIDEYHDNTIFFIACERGEIDVVKVYLYNIDKLDIETGYITS